MEANDREPAAILPRIYYLTDTPSAIKYAHATIFGNEQKIHDLFGFRAPVAPLTTFVVEHPRFYVVGTYDYPEDWLLRKLVASGATVDYRGHFTSSYKDTDLYLITIGATTNIQ